MGFAVISDIHSNLEALRAVLADISGQGIDTIYCLGDVVGYGPDPEKCLTLAFETCEVIVMGNHDLAVLSEALDFNPVARDSVDWTRRRIKPGHFSRRSKKTIWKRLEAVPVRHIVGDFMFVHGSPRDEISEYVNEADIYTTDGELTEKIRDIQAKAGTYCFVGHTHRAGIISPDGKFYRPSDFGNCWPLMGGPLIINPGSVGQPRDNDPRASYCLVDGKIIRYRRVEYDVKRVTTKIEKSDGLDPRLSFRLKHGF